MRTPTPSYLAPPCEEEVTILYQDDDILVVDKPAGLLSMPGPDPQYESDNLVRRLQEDFEEIRLVHRLDRLTSGVMVIARHKESQKRLNQSFQYREVKKRYVAVVDGIVEAQCGDLRFPLKPDWPNKPRQKIDFVEGKPCHTQYKVLERDTQRGCTRVSLTPVTGRTHQLRLHMTAIGHPIWGCELYAPDDAFEASSRLLLHACWLRFAHPITRQWMEWTCPAPF
ncbi:MAG TPA: RNA pseudouridine synthase [Myxococcales bacterium]|nr:RNA pseudouridine synthase [Deltaproteobacteria bacterium]MBU49760.1 RNA pseudouridine synthase [Deltaproteobacteria bacterium]HAA59044.1 RNA pseudouridine synthase [Myxococcales bacterium]